MSTCLRCHSGRLLEGATILEAAAAAAAAYSAGFQMFLDPMLPTSGVRTAGFAIELQVCHLL